ncbi:MAG TPA: hypothetical protein VK673_19985 [Chthoniobacterales bacterium]|nr:hypothetical protein [Chthoniobacterales bacterium]
MEPIQVSEATQRAHAWSHLVIGAAIEVHRIKGARVNRKHLQQVFPPGMRTSVDSGPT